MYQYTEQDSAKQCFNASKVTSYILVILSTLLSLLSGSDYWGNYP